VRLLAKKIFTVGFDLPGDDFQLVEFETDRTLLDADIVLFKPKLNVGYQYEQHNGKTLLSKAASVNAKTYIKHWRSEILEAVDAGKLVIVYLVRPLECFCYTGETSFSGVGKSRVTQNGVAEINSYESIPFNGKFLAKSGSEVRVEQGRQFLNDYWSKYSGISNYEVELKGDFKDALLKSKTGDRVVGAMIKGKNGGHLLLLPPLKIDEEEFTREPEADEEDYEEFWTDDALEFGNRLAAELRILARHLEKNDEVSLAPEWCSASIYKLDLETKLDLAVITKKLEIAKLQEEQKSLESRLSDSRGLRRLLFEQGKPLELAVLDAMKLFGFEVEQYIDSESEFDGIFTSVEGRCLGEVEGRDTKSINIEKFSQLERNLQEDFQREEVSKHAKGILFGNAHRLKPLEEREQFFTDKCISAAKRIGAALIRTPDLFSPARYIKENPGDLQFALQCRQAILASAGTIVTFPSIPDAKGISE
jgi:hypothetical protein